MNRAGIIIGSGLKIRPMKKIDIVKKLESKGYKITFLISGGYMAKKNQNMYIEPTLNKLWNTIMKPL